MNKKVKFPIALKLVIIVSILAVLALGAITAISTYFLRLDVQLTAEQNNFTVNSQAASITESELDNLKNNTIVFMSSLAVLGFDNEAIPYFTQLYFDASQDTAVMSVIGEVEFINADFFEKNEVSVNEYHNFLNASEDLIDRATKGELLFANVTSTFGIPAIAMLLPWTGSDEPRALISVHSAETLTETFGSDTTSTSFMVNDRNDVLVHPDYDLMHTSANMSNVPLVEEMRKNNDTNRQIMFTDEDGTEFFGAYTKLPIGDVGIITAIEANLVFENVDATAYQNLLLSLAVLFLTIIFIRFFAKSITKPIIVLTDASEQVEQGNFSLDLESKSGDEIGLLTSRFVSMCKGLETFGRFVNLDVAIKAMKGNLKLGGESKEATIFFSDIRAFTEMAERLEPKEVIDFLNDYMTRMVSCVKVTGGAVDKFIGDAIMAVWGASSSVGSPKEDAISSIRASFMMRSALQEFNSSRGGYKQPLITMGCGINTGLVVAGQVGSEERMEYTVIGDAVNLASRTEMLTKVFSTDILITENTYELVKDLVVVEKMPMVKVKGKEEAIQIYAVINMPYEETIKGAGKNGPKTIQELRRLLGFPTPDFTKIDVSAEERKYNLES